MQQPLSCRNKHQKTKMPAAHGSTAKIFGALPPYKRKDTFNMDRVDIKELFAHPESYYDKTVTVAGWARTVRDSKAIG